jgi:glutamate formiminotransferase / formiminotetrahydrofolate cyclodeaminase
MPIASEIVGLIPKKALEDAAEWFLQIENFDSSLILENRLAAVMSGKTAVGGLRAGIEPFLEQVAAPTAAPGGGSAAAATAAIAAGLCSMVAGMSRGKKNYLQFENELSAALARLAQLREDLAVAIDTDTEAYQAVVQAYKQAKSSADGGLAVNEALKGATLVPLGVLERAREVGEWAERLRPATNPKMASDLTAAASLARAALEGALANVDINLESITDERFKSEIGKRLAELGVR